MGKDNDFFLMCQKLKQRKEKESEEHKEIDMYELAREEVKNYIYESNRKHPLLALKAEIRACDYKEMRSANISMLALAVSAFTLIITLLAESCGSDSIIYFRYGVAVLAAIVFFCVLFLRFSRKYSVTEIWKEYIGVAIEEIEQV